MNINLFISAIWAVVYSMSFADSLPGTITTEVWSQSGDVVVNFNRIGVYAAGGRGYYASLETWQSDLSQANELRASVVRFNSDVWDQLEPREGQYEWAKLEKLVTLVQKHHMQMLFTLPLSNKWNSSQPRAIEKEIKVLIKGKEYKEKVRLGHHHFPVRADKLESVRHFSHALATQFKGRIKYYELWNEPDFARYWGGQPNAQDYLEYCKRAYQAIKQADPKAIIIMGGLAFPEETTWFNEFLKLGGGAYFDRANIHVYPAHSELPRALNNVRELLSKYNLRKNIWITEINSTGGYYETNDREAEELKQANYLVKNITMALAEPDVEKIIFYLRDPGKDVGLQRDFDLGIIRNISGGVETKPAYNLLSNVFAIALEAKSIKKTPHPKIEIYSFIRNKSQVLMLWSKSGSVNYKLPKSAVLFSPRNAKINDKNELEVTEQLIILIAPLN